MLATNPAEEIRLRAHMRRWLGERAEARRVDPSVLARPLPSGALDLAERAYELTGLRVPAQAVCPEHTAPLAALAEAFFATSPVVVWHASRGFGGKTTLLALLGHLETVLLGAEVTILGGSGQQSQRVHEAQAAFWRHPAAPNHLLDGEPTRYQTRLANGGGAVALMASSRSVRGGHPQKLRLDECDEIKLDIFDAALGQTMATPGVPAQTVMSSTHQYADGCVAADTPVRTSRGEMPVIDVAAGDLVLTRQGWRRVEAMVLSGYKRVVDLRLSNGRILTCTDDHRIATPDGWSIPRWLLPGDEVVGIAPDLAVVQPEVPAQSLSSAGAPDASVVTALQPPAGLADSAAVHGKGRVAARERVALATRLQSAVDGRRPETSQCVDALRNDVEMGRIDAGSIPTQVIEGQAIRDAAHETDERPAVGAALEVLAMDRAISAGLSALPNPTVIDNMYPTQEPIFIVDISHTSSILVPVYDLQVNDVHEFVGSGIVIHNTFTEVLRRAADRGWPIRRWCYRDVLQPHGWLDPAEVERKRAEVPAAMWAAEYDLAEPSPESRAIQPEMVEAMFAAELGTFAGRPGEAIELEPPRDGASYATGADWAKEQDWTVVTTVRTDLRPCRVVAYERNGRRPWPQMVEILDRRLARYPGTAAHDATGLGDVVEDLLTSDVDGVKLVGRTRADLLSEYIKAIENGELESPRIEHGYGEHKYASLADVYGSGHLPDSICAGALAWYAYRHPPKRRAVYVY